MCTSKLIELLTTQDVPDAEAYNLLVEDIVAVLPEAAATLEGQVVINYFAFQLREVCFPVMRKLREAVRAKDAEIGNRVRAFDALLDRRMS